MAADEQPEGAAEQGHPPIRDPREIGFGRLFTALQDAVVVSDDEGRVVLWNPGATRLFGYTEAEAVGKNVTLLIPPAFREAHAAGLRRYRATGRGRFLDHPLPLELPALRKDGKEIVVEMTLTSFEDGSRRFVLAIQRDVTERARLRRELERRTTELEASLRAYREANRALESFSYVVSHDLKVPVRAAQAYLGAVLEDHAEEIGGEALRRLRDTQEALARLSTFMHALLEMSRLSAGDLLREPVAIEDVLEAEMCRASYSALLEDGRAQLEVVQGIPRVFGSFPILCQVLGNCITNGIRHNPSACPLVRVSGDAKADGTAEIRIEDNGDGFPEEVLDRFQAAGPLTSLATAQGSGFGLAIARLSVEKLGGTMTLGRSEDLGGGLVSVRLPMPPPARAPTARQAE